jgi:hypothetical protein
MFAWTVTRADPPRYVLTGPDSPNLSALLMILVMAGARIEMKSLRSRYVVTGSNKTMENLSALVAAEPGAAEAGFSLKLETEAPVVLSLKSEPIRSTGYRRVSEIQGHLGHVREFIARAIDYRLYPTFVGAGRFTVTGPTEQQMRWAADVVLRKPLADTMQALGVTADMVAREDRDGQPIVMTSIPRVSRTRIETDAAGNLTSSVTTDFEAGDEPPDEL